MSSIAATRRHLVLAIAALALALRLIPASAETITDDKLHYRGFTVDVSAAQQLPDFEAIEKSTRHQLDIAADCGAKPEIIGFFRSRKITLVRGLPEPPGRFVPQRGVEIEAKVLPEEQPIILHELMHAYHSAVLPAGVRNADVLRFYAHARDAGLYPANAYVLTNVNEFFAVTASLYLWGNVDRPPHNRETLKSKQPYFYAWLGSEFGVEK